MAIVRVNLILTPEQASYLASVLSVGNDEDAVDHSHFIMVEEIGERIERAVLHAKEGKAVSSAEWYGLAPSEPQPMTADHLVPIGTLAPQYLRDPYDRFHEADELRGAP